MNNQLKYIIILILSLIIIGAATVTLHITNDPPQHNPHITFLQNSYSFENGLSPWQKKGTDLDNPPINWSITPSTDYSTNGTHSLKFYLENFNDAGKIWIENNLQADPNTIYTITITYQFATADFGDLNLFNLITTVSPHPIQTRDDLNYEGDTGHHTNQTGYVWLNKTFTYTIKTTENGTIYTNIGVWGSWETTRTYYLDNVTITAEKHNPTTTYPNISGIWTLSEYNWEGTLTRQENVTITQNNTYITIHLDLAPNATGYILQNTESNPQHQTDFIIQGIDFHGLGINTIYLLNETTMITELPALESQNPAIFTR